VLQLGVAAHACNPRTWEAGQEDHLFKTSLGLEHSETLHGKQKKVCVNVNKKENVYVLH
jgi:hypothetical protein